MSIVSLLVWLVLVLTGLANGAETLASLEQVDDYPLYTMTYVGEYDATLNTEAVFSRVPGEDPGVSYAGEGLTWGCSLFAAFADAENALYGRNFDWQFSPALLLFTDPPDGYASVSMVDIAYLGFDGAAAYGLTDLPLDALEPLLSAPNLPFDGMNEHGLVVGMAAVPGGNVMPDPTLETVGSLMIIRLVLDHARTVDEAVAIFEDYNVSMEGGGPPLHYLIADSSGEAVLVEYYEGEMVVIPNANDWHMATNHLRAAVAAGQRSTCWRYDGLDEELTQSEGRLTMQEALDLLEAVSQSNTQWSIVYGIGSGEIRVVMDRQYEMVHEFHLDLAVDDDAE